MCLSVCRLRPGSLISVTSAPALLSLSSSFTAAAPEAADGSSHSSAHILPRNTNQNRHELPKPEVTSPLKNAAHVLFEFIFL